jgi:hypothetical protein
VVRDFVHPGGVLSAVSQPGHNYNDGYLQIVLL